MSRHPLHRICRARSQRHRRDRQVFRARSRRCRRDRRHCPVASRHQLLRPCRAMSRRYRLRRARVLRLHLLCQRVHRHCRVMARRHRRRVFRALSRRCRRYHRAFQASCRHSRLDRRRIRVVSHRHIHRVIRVRSLRHRQFLVRCHLGSLQCLLRLATSHRRCQAQNLPIPHLVNHQLILLRFALQAQVLMNQEQTTQQGAVKVLFVAMVGAAPKIWAIAQEMTKFAVLLGGSCVEVVRSRNVAPVLTAPLAIITAQVLMAMNVLRSVRNSYIQLEISILYY